MTALRFDGLVDCEQFGNPGHLRIGGRDVIKELVDEFGYQGKQVTVALLNERWDGLSDFDQGMEGYSEWTPGEPAKVYVGDHDVLARLEELNGREVTLWIADEPIDLNAGAS